MQCRVFSVIRMCKISFAIRMHALRNTTKFANQLVECHVVVSCMYNFNCMASPLSLSLACIVECIAKVQIKTPKWVFRCHTHSATQVDCRTRRSKCCVGQHSGNFVRGRRLAGADYFVETSDWWSLRRVSRFGFLESRQHRNLSKWNAYHSECQPIAWRVFLVPGQKRNRCRSQQIDPTDGARWVGINRNE